MKHWGSLAIMAYAMGKGKPCILLAPPDCIIWKSHIVYHPLVTRFTVNTCESACQALSEVLRC